MKTCEGENGSSHNGTATSSKCPRKTRGTPALKHRGVFQERANGSWTATAGFDTNKRRIRMRGFPDQASALLWRNNQLSAAKVPCMNPEEIVFAARAMAQLREANQSPDKILAMVAMGLKSVAQLSQITLEALALEYLKTKDFQELRSKQSFRHGVAPFLKKIGRLPVAEIGRDEIREVVDSQDWQPTTVRNHLTSLSQLFTFAQREQFLGPGKFDNPVTRMGKPAARKRGATPFSVPEAQALLNLAWETEQTLHCTRWISLALFCGVRDSELKRLRNEHIDLFSQPPKLTITLEVARKKHRGREALIPKNLEMILGAMMGTSRIRPSGLIFPTRKDRVEFQALAKTNGVAWKHNGLRAGFASHHAQLDPTLESTKNSMGHVGGLQTLRDHYVVPVPPGDGRRYFALLPKGLASDQRGAP